MKAFFFILAMTATTLIAGIQTYKGNDGLYGLKDDKGRIVMVPVFETVTHFKNGVAAVKKLGKWGLIDSKGQYICECIYDSVNFFSNGLARVNFNGKYGFVDIKGNLIIDTQYDYADNFIGGISRVKLSDKWLVLNAKGDHLTLPVFDGIGKFREKVALVKIDKSYGLIDNTGNNIVPVNTSEYKWLSKNMLGFKKNSGGWHIYSTSGQELKDLNYDEVEMVSPTTFKFKQNNKWGLIDSRGEILVQALFDDVSSLKSNRARILDNGKYGFIDQNGKIVIAPMYEHATEFDNGISQVRLNGSWSWINTKGQSIIRKEDLNFSNDQQEINNAAQPQEDPIEVRALEAIERAERKNQNILRTTRYYYYGYPNNSILYHSPYIYYPRPYRPAGHYRHRYGNVLWNDSNWAVTYGRYGFGLNYTGNRHFTIRF